MNKISRENKYTEQSNLWFLLFALPIFTSVYIAILGVVSVLLLLFEAQIALLAITISSIIFISLARLLWTLCRKTITYLGGKSENRIIFLIALFFIFIWGGFNVRYVSENVYIHKDPAIYSNTAVWLTKHDNINIQSTEILGESDEFDPSSNGIEMFFNDRSRLYVQAPHYFPSLLSYFGTFFGLHAIVFSNILIAMLSLLLFFTFLRFFVTPRWALLALFLLGASLPMIYFSRDTYTEPLTIVLIFTALITNFLLLSFIHPKVQKKKKNQKINRQYLLLFLSAGLLSSAPVLVRVDTYIIPSLMLMALTLALLIIKISNAKFYLLSYIVGSSLMVLLGWIDLSRLSAEYYNSLHSEIISQIALWVFVSFISILVINVKKIQSLFNYLIDKVNTRSGLLILSLILFLSFIFIISRPLWLEVHRSYFNNEYVASLQEINNHEVIDGTRFYAEQTHLWIVWYLGIAILPMGFVGFTLFLVQFVRAKDVKKLATMIIFLSLTAVYFNYPRITPDQIWASRRFLPVIFPLFIFFAVYLLFEVDKRISIKKSLRYFLFFVVFLVLLYQPYSTTKPFLTHKAFAGFWDEIDLICETIPKDHVVMVVGSNSRNIVFPLKSYCGLEAEGMKEPSEQDFVNAKNNAKELGYEVVVLLVGHDYDYLPRGSEILTLSTTPFNELERTLIKKPTGLNSYKRVIFLSSINSDGELIPFTIDSSSEKL